MHTFVKYVPKKAKPSGVALDFGLQIVGIGFIDVFSVVLGSASLTAFLGAEAPSVHYPIEALLKPINQPGWFSGLRV